MRIGSLLAIKEDKDFKDAVSMYVKSKKNTTDLAAMLIAAFGNGKGKE